MAVVPSPPVFAPGISFTTQLSQLVSVLDFLLAPPRLEVRQTTLQSIPTGASTALTFTTEDLDSDAQHDTATDTSRFTAAYAGWYLCAGAACFAANATGVRITQWAVNGTVQNGSDTEITPVTGAVTVVPARTKKFYLNVGDYVELRAFQNSGGSLNTGVTTSNQSGMSVHWVSN